MAGKSGEYVSRGGEKLAHALDGFGIDPAGRVCADLGCSTGGFTDVLLRRGAERVYSVDTGYGVLEWKLRCDDRVVAMERTNALHVVLPEPCSLVVIDASWTRQELIVAHALDLLGPGGEIVSLVKPHYEAPRKWLRRGVLPTDRHDEVIADVLESLSDLARIDGSPLESPILGGKGGNREYLVHLFALEGDAD